MVDNIVPLKATIKYRGHNILVNRNSISGEFEWQVDVNKPFKFNGSEKQLDLAHAKAKEIIDQLEVGLVDKGFI